MKSSRIFRCFAGICFAVLFLILIVPALLPKGPRWYVLNPRYALWTHGWYHYDRLIVYSGLNGDIWRNDVVHGKTLPELQTMFGQLHELSEFDNYALAKVSSLTNSTCTFVIWADTDWFIEITNGKASAINLWKG